jgi:hypothetical protein
LAAPAPTTAAPRVLPEGEKPGDRRLGDLRSLNDYFPFIPPETAGQWEVRAEAVRRRLLVALGLWPMPSPTPARAVIHGKVDRDGYTVEKVYFESFPGHLVTGSLYRPAGAVGKLPAILSPHGHWANGRFHDDGETNVRKRIVEGAERFEVGGRHPLQARCVQLARMGCIVFHYDMVGNADSIPLSHAPRLRESLCTAENWGFAGPQAELRLQNHMGLQTYNYPSRAVMYSWMNKHLKLGLEEPIVEEDYLPLSREEMSVWNEEHPAPAQRGEEHERALVRWMTDSDRTAAAVAWLLQ